MLGFFSALAATPRLAHADSSAADRSVAQSLFDESKDLMAAGKFAEACPKLEESERLDPGGGTMLNLALCHESEGRVATAWSDFAEALSLARRDGRADREHACQEHIAALRPKMPLITLSIPAPASGEVLQLDGAQMGSAVWGRPAPVDPGPHQLSVSAPGKEPWELRFELALAEQKTIEIPALVDSPQAPSAQPAPVGAEAGGAAADQGKSRDAVKKRRTVAYIIGGSGIVVAGVGGFFGLRALSKKSDSDKLCPTDTTCSPEGKTANDDAKTAAWVADIGVGLGLVGIGIGTYLLVTAGKAEQPPGAPAKTATERIWFDANALPGGARAAVGGVF